MAEIEEIEDAAMMAVLRSARETMHEDNIVIAGGRVNANSVHVFVVVDPEHSPIGETVLMLAQAMARIALEMVRGEERPNLDTLLHDAVDYALEIQRGQRDAADDA
jgi:hypothetical protein